MRSALTQHFGEVGEVVQVRIPTDLQNRPKGIALVVMADMSAKERAASLDNSLLLGRFIRLDMDAGPAPRSSSNTSTSASNTVRTLEPMGSSTAHATGVGSTSSLSRGGTDSVREGGAGQGSAEPAGAPRRGRFLA